jgi:hypothetical protein
MDRQKPLAPPRPTGKPLWGPCRPLIRIRTSARDLLGAVAGPSPWPSRRLHVAPATGLAASKDAVGLRRAIDCARGCFRPILIPVVEMQSGRRPAC